MKIIAILRIKNEASIIKECLDNLALLVDEIVVLDNGSTDGTLEIYPKYKKIVKLIKTEGFDEGRDKCLLLEEAKKLKPDWILWIDGDEVFEKAFTREVLEKYMHSKCDRVAFRLCHFWLGRTHCRIDGKWLLYSLNPRARMMWRNLDKTYFINKKIHNGLIQGIDSKILYSPYRVKHYGYIDKQKVQSKYDLYTKIDAKNISYYSHLNPEAKFRGYRFREYDNKIRLLLATLFFSYFLTNLFWLFDKLKISVIFFKFVKWINKKTR